MVTLGNERLFDDEQFDLIRGQRIGLITNHSGVDSQLRATADRLHETDGCDLVALFGPEHGIRGDVADGAVVTTDRDPQTGVTAHSLYGETNKPDEHMLDRIDVMLFDIQDVGVRFYTYLYTMSLSMEACATRNIPFLLLDRPNPIGGVQIAGRVLDPPFASFVGLYPIPVQYGMTIGEIARLFNETFAIDADLHVVPLQGWKRDLFWEDTGLPWVYPSPNMPTVDTAVIYPGMCFFEGTNLSEGRGTVKPFEQVGAPFVDAYRLADYLNQLELPGVLFRPVYFQPSFGKHADQVCQGVQLHILDRSSFQAVRTGFEVIDAARRLFPDDFAWRIPGKGIYNFDRLAGTDAIRLALDRGTPVVDLVADWQPDLDRFDDLRRSFLLYE
ncbi:MAG: DUF1343 domain-containing protein [Gemmatimonadetes bacterium]|jgi:uncharacterized protein YbbC (DUF1343 family)|nr:DUF1343 domain-containing protein [Gemmatimonadota bacterium]